MSYWCIFFCLVDVSVSCLVHISVSFLVHVSFIVLLKLMFLVLLIFLLLVLLIYLFLVFFMYLFLFCWCIFFFVFLMYLFFVLLMYLFLAWSQISSDWVSCPQVSGQIYTAHTLLLGEGRGNGAQRRIYADTLFNIVCALFITKKNVLLNWLAYRWLLPSKWFLLFKYQSFFLPFVKKKTNINENCQSYLVVNRNQAY